MLSSGACCQRRAAACLAQTDTCKPSRSFRFQVMLEAGRGLRGKDKLTRGTCTESHDAGRGVCLHSYRPASSPAYLNLPLVLPEVTPAPSPILRPREGTNAEGVSTRTLIGETFQLVHPLQLYSSFKFSRRNLLTAK